jgi:hypothetical protein
VKVVKTIIRCTWILNNVERTVKPWFNNFEWTKDLGGADSATDLEVF